MVTRKRITDFSPEIIRITNNCNLPFNAGQGFDTFNSFLTDDVEDYFLNGDGVTYLIKNGEDLVAYYCLSSGAIPFDYICENESEMWGIPVIEIRMFAVNQPYQNAFFEYNDLDMPIAAWCLHFIVENSQSQIGTKAMFLHSVPTAEKFYIKNGFQEINNVMEPFHCIDDNLKPLWLPLQSIEFGDGITNDEDKYP